MGESKKANEVGKNLEAQMGLPDANTLDTSMNIKQNIIKEKEHFKTSQARKNNV